MMKMLLLLIFGILFGAVEPRSVNPILMNSSERDFYYMLESVFENALDLSNVSSDNNYALQSGFAAILNSNSPLQCIPIRYVIICDKPSSNCTTETMLLPECACANETADYYYETWQWTSFRMDFAGNFIITWSRIGFVAFGFHWNRYCEFATKDIVQLQIHLSEFPPVSESLQRTHEALNSLTRTVVKHEAEKASGITKSPSSGYSSKWMDPETFFHESSAVVGVYLGLAVLSVFAILIAAVLLHFFYVFLKRSSIKINKNVYFYSALWSFEIVVIIIACTSLGNLIGICIIYRRNYETSIPIIVNVVFYLSVLVFNLIGSVIYIIFIKPDVRFPIPVLFCCCISDNLCSRILGFVFVLMKFIAFSYMVLCIPSVVLAFFVTTTTTIVRLSYLEVAVVAVFGSCTFLIFSFEKCRSPKRHYTQEVDEDPEQGEGLINGSSNTLTKCRRNCCKNLTCTRTGTFLVLISTLCLLITLAIVVLIGIVVFVITLEETSADSLLKALPAVFINIFLFRRAQDEHSEVVKALKDISAGDLKNESEENTYM